MADLPDESVQRIAQGRIEAERVLREAFKRMPHSEDYQDYIPPFLDYARRIFDNEAREHLLRFSERQPFEAFLTGEVLPRVLEDMLPDRSLVDAWRAKPRKHVPRRVVRREMRGAFWEETSDGLPVPVSEETQIVEAQHGDWENLAPRHICFEFRLSPAAEDTVRQTLLQELRLRVYYWAGKVPTQTRASQFDNKEQPREILGRLRSKYRISRQSLAGRAGISRDTLRKIERGERVREENIAAVAEAFQDLGEKELTYQDLIP